MISNIIILDYDLVLNINIGCLMDSFVFVLKRFHLFLTVLFECV